VDQEYSRFGFTNDLKMILDEMNLTLISQERSIYKLLRTKKLDLVLKRRMENILLYVFQNNNNTILHFQTPFEEFIIIDKNTQIKSYNSTLLFIFLFLLLSIIFVAFTIYKKLFPLYELQSKIDHIGDTDMKLDFLKKDAQDEVSVLARTLLEKSKNLNQITKARDVFIRNIMHELKTPITKGRFLLELENTQENKEKLQKVFYQLESLISEFAVIEEVIAKKENIEKKDIFFDDILENDLDILMIEDENTIETTHKPLKLHVNFKLFSIVVKNIIDNALKYSNDKKVTITIKTNTISFENTGKSLQYKLDQYYEPFFSNQANDKESFGLGLYIIKSVLDVHNFTLGYEYKNGNNIFTIHLS